ncbi:MAG: glycosyltransferase family 4 protein [Opitutaceae bacterium]|nr:glycosyltransferase family 4 protein [Opitutaceae bacterium]
MKITFVLPGGARYPAGGTRMVFRYANALAQSGTAITVVMPSDLSLAPFWKRVLRLGRYGAWAVVKGYSPDRWIDLHPAIRLLWTPSLASAWAPEGDAVVATSVRTAEMVATWPAKAGRKFYFVQGYETWDFPRARVEASWKLPLEKFAVSTWLCSLIGQVGETSTCLRNSVDCVTFGLDRPVEERDPASLLWPHHPLPQKGSIDVMNVVYKLLADHTNRIKISAFAASKKPADWPPKISYSRNPLQHELRRLYNDAAIMIAPSRSEGWGLPACEALVCGCGVIATDIGGHREFLRHEENALLYPPSDLDALGRSILRLLGDPALRIRLARQGQLDMQALILEPMVVKLEGILKGVPMP